MRQTNTQGKGFESTQNPQSQNLSAHNLAGHNPAQSHAAAHNLTEQGTRLDSINSALDSINPEPNAKNARCVEFARLLSVCSGKVIKPLGHFSSQSHEEKRAMSFGLFAPLACAMMTRAGVCEGIVLHPFFGDESSESVRAYRYEIGTEHGVSALLGLECEILCEFVRELDVGYIVNESSLCDEEVSRAQAFVREGGALLLGRDLYLHPQSAFIAQILGSVARERDIEVFVQDLLEPCSAPKSPVAPNGLGRDKLDGDGLDGGGLHSGGLDPALLEELPESNGAFGYVCLESELPKTLKALMSASNGGCETLCAPESFRAILKVSREGAYGMQYRYEGEGGEQCATQERELRFCPVLKGTIGCLPSAEVAHYPFVRIAALEPKKRD